MTVQRPITLTFARQQQVFTVLGTGIAGSLVFWPLLTSFLSIGLFVFWLAAAEKQFSLKDQRSRLVLLFTSLYALVLIGCLYSANMKEALFKLQQQSALGMFPLVIGTSVAFDRRVAHRILTGFAWCTLAGCLACLGYGLLHLAQTGSAGRMHGYEMVMLKDMSPFMLGLFCLLSIIYLLPMLYRGRFETARRRNIYFGVTLLLSLFLLVLGNRNVLFSWSLVMAYFVLTNMTGRWFRMLFVGLLLAALASAAIFNPSFRRQIRDLTDFSPSNTIQLDSDKSLGRGWGGKALRLAIWKCSGDVIRAHWIAGVGTGDVQDSLQAAYERRQFYFASRYNKYNAHNQFIQEAIAYGLPGFVLFCACLLVPFYIYLRSGGWQLYILFLLSFAVICITESVLEISKGIVFYSLFNSIFAFVPVMQSEDNQQ